MRLLIWLIIVIAVIVALVNTCFFVVDQTEFAVVKRFGDPVRTLIEPGLGLKYPWPIDAVARLDNRLMILENPGPGEPPREYLTEDKQAGIGKNVMVTTYTCWRIQRDPAAVLTFLMTMGDRASAEARLGDVVVSELGAALGRNDFSVLISTDASQRGWSELVTGILERCRQRVQHAYGIEIVDIQLQRLNFPEQNRRNVFDRMRAERETIASRYRSMGDEEATKIRARANRERDEILAQADMEAKQIRGRANAEAAAIYARAYNQDADFYEFLRTLEAYEQTFDEQTVTILSADSEFLHLLNQAAAPATEARAEQPHASGELTTQPAQPE